MIVEHKARGDGHGQKLNCFQDGVLGLKGRVGRNFSRRKWHGSCG